MTIGALVQARLSSRRLPGKVVAPLAGRPALEWLLERLAHARELDLVAVATSSERSDDAIAALCADVGTVCVRGPLDDVALRLTEAAEELSLDALVRVNGDSPLLDQRLVDHGVSLFRADNRDLVTNVRPPTFPAGQSVEVVSTTALRVGQQAMTADEREHVTRRLYEMPGLRILNFGTSPPQRDVRLTLDTPDDQERLDRLLRGMERPHWEYRWDEIAELARGVAC